MTEPVKLSRERWRALETWRNPNASIVIGYPPSITAVDRPTEIDGVIVLPAEYVPAREPVRWLGIDFGATPGFSA